MIFCDEYENSFCKNHGMDRQLLDELLEQLNLFAKNTHTLGNYMCCPDSKYNFVKSNYSKYKGRIELLYKDVKDCSKDEHRLYYEWFDKNKKKLKLSCILDNDDLLKFVFNGYKMSKKNIKPYLEYVKTINSLIEKRGNDLVNKLAPNP